MIRALSLAALTALVTAVGCDQKEAEACDYGGQEVFSFTQPVYQQQIIAQPVVAYYSAPVVQRQVVVEQRAYAPAVRRQVIVERQRVYPQRVRQRSVARVRVGY